MTWFVATIPADVSLKPFGLLNQSAHVFVIAFMVALIATPFVRRIAYAQDIVDRPDEARKQHSRTTPYLGGVAVFLGILAGVIVSWVSPGDLFVYRGVPLGVVVGMIAMAVVGLADDAGGWDPRTKIAGQLVAAAGLAIDQIGTDVAKGLLSWLWHENEVILTVLGEPFYGGDVMYWVGIAVIAIFVLGASNAANFIDGLDGLLSGTVAIFTVGVLVVSLILTSGYDRLDPATGLSVRATATTAAVEAVDPAGANAAPGGAAAAAIPAATAATAPSETPLPPPDRSWAKRSASDELPVARVVLALAILGAVLGFLPWNFNPAVIFLGDCGSLMLGYLCAVMILMLGDLGKTHFVVAGLIMFGLPIMDTMLAIMRRRLAGVSMSAADSNHIHHIVKRSVGSVRGAVMVLYAVCVVFALVGIGLSALVSAELGDGNVRARSIYAVAIVIFGFIGVLALKSARLRQLDEDRVRRQAASDAREEPGS